MKTRQAATNQPPDFSSKDIPKYQSIHIEGTLLGDRPNRNVTISTYLDLNEPTLDIYKSIRMSSFSTPNLIFYHKRKLSF
jgi:hypothetical protein